MLFSDAQVLTAKLIAESRQILMAGLLSWQSE